MWNFKSCSLIIELFTLFMYKINEACLSEWWWYLSKTLCLADDGQNATPVLFNKYALDREESCRGKVIFIYNSLSKLNFKSL